MPFRQGHLRYFVTVADEGQITRAARKLNIAQPALSQAMTQLEADIGFALFERAPARCHAHPGGASLLHTGLAGCGGRRGSRADRGLADAHRRGHDRVRLRRVAARARQPQNDPCLRRRPPGDRLPLPRTPVSHAATPGWIADVDIAVAHAPPAHEEVWSHPLRRRAARGAGPEEAPPRRARCGDGRGRPGGDVHRPAPVRRPPVGRVLEPGRPQGRPPRNSTPDRAANPHEVLAALAVPDAITTVPSSVAAVILNVLSGIVAVPITDAAPCTIMLVGHADRRNPLVASVLRFARRLAPEEEGAPDEALSPGAEGGTSDLYGSRNSILHPPWWRDRRSATSRASPRNLEPISVGEVARGGCHRRSVNPAGWAESRRRVVETRIRRQSLRANSLPGMDTKTGVEQRKVGAGPGVFADALCASRRHTREPRGGRARCGARRAWRPHHGARRHVL